MRGELRGMIVCFSETPGGMLGYMIKIYNNVTQPTDEHDSKLKRKMTDQLK